MATQKSTALTEKQIHRLLKALSDWHINKKYTTLSRTFSTPNFVTGLAFVAKITVHAEILNHHPDVELSYKEVKVTLTTHDLGGLTKKDFELADLALYSAKCLLNPFIGGFDQAV